MCSPTPRRCAFNTKMAFSCYISSTKQPIQPNPGWVRVRYSRMSKWNLIISGGRALATPGDLTPRWCLHVGSRPCRRVTAHGFGPGAYRGRDNIAGGVPTLRR